MASLCAILVLLMCNTGGLVLVSAQEENMCYGPGSIATTVILSVILTALIVCALYYLWKNYKSRKAKHLILQTDVEKGNDEFAFDNPGFKDTTISSSSATKSMNKNDVLAAETNSKANKWNQWSPLAGLMAKSVKQKTLDDSAIDFFQDDEVKVVALRSHDFTGLGFNICGNMKEGIYIKDVLHRGPASESGKLNSGDRINSVTISFEHMVYEDALTILSYASPYEVMIEARGGKIIHNTLVGGQGAQPTHPVYRSSSYTDLFQAEKSAQKKLFSGSGDDDFINSSLSSNYSSLQKSRSNMTTLERQESKSPKPISIAKKQLNPDQLKAQLEKKILPDYQQNIKNKLMNSAIKLPAGAADVRRFQSIEMQQNAASSISENNNKQYQKFGIKVLPLPSLTATVEQREQHIVSPTKHGEVSQNDNNINFERHQETTVHEVDNKVVPQAKKRERKLEIVLEPSDLENVEFLRSTLTNGGGSGIKRDKNGIPQEIPALMMNAAVAARSNRKSSEDRITMQNSHHYNKENEMDSKTTPKKLKGKAPAPPSNDEDAEEIDEEESLSKSINRILEQSQLERNTNDGASDMNSDSDIETGDNQSSSVNTIELNASDITIHHEEEEESEAVKLIRQQNRRTASTGDLTKISKTRKSSISNNNGTLERAQSLDITDGSIRTNNKGEKDEDRDLVMIRNGGSKDTDQEPKSLSLILDGLNTFQRNRLKKSTEWGNLEDIISSDIQSNSRNAEKLSGKESIGIEEFNALVSKVNAIKRESLMELGGTRDINHIEDLLMQPSETRKAVKNKIWPDFFEESSATLSKAADATYMPKAPEKKHKKSHLNVAAPPPPPQNETIKSNKLVIDNITNTACSTKNESKIDDLPNSNSVTNVEISDHYESNLMQQARQDEPPNKSYEKPSTNNTDEPPLMKPKIPVKSTELLDKIESISLDKDAVSINEIIKKKSNLINITNNFILTERIASSCLLDEEKTMAAMTILELEDINISDDIKVSRHSMGSLERSNSPTQSPLLLSDLKLLEYNNINNVSNITVISNSNHCTENGQQINGDANLHSLELNIMNESTDEGGDLSTKLYSTALDDTLMVCDESADDPSIVTINAPDLIKNMTSVTTSTSSEKEVTKRNNLVNNSSGDVILKEPDSLTFPGVPSELVEVTENKFSTVTNKPTVLLQGNHLDRFNVEQTSPASQTYITEIQVLTPNNNNHNNNKNDDSPIHNCNNISDIKVLPNNCNNNKVNLASEDLEDAISTTNDDDERNLDSEFENYVKNFESLNSFDSNIQRFTDHQNADHIMNNDETMKNTKSIVITTEKIDAEKELHKIQKIVEEQLKKLPEMRFTTSSYHENNNTSNDNINNTKRNQSQSIEMLRSNFEKSPLTKSSSQKGTTENATIIKSRIPIATSPGSMGLKTPPMSPERRNSRTGLDGENNMAILEFMSSPSGAHHHSTPKHHHQLSGGCKSASGSSKNVTVTSIRNNSKIPSGLPVLSGGGRPPIPPRKHDSNALSLVADVEHVTTNGRMESSFKQWVFNPASSDGNNAITNIIVSDNKTTGM